jgi:hypothetical protein
MQGMPVATEFDRGNGGDHERGDVPELWPRVAERDADQRLVRRAAVGPVLGDLRGSGARVMSVDAATAPGVRVLLEIDEPH